MSDSNLLIELSWTEIFSLSVYSICKNRGIEEEPDIAAVVRSCKDIDVDCEERINIENASCPSVDGTIHNRNDHNMSNHRYLTCWHRRYQVYNAIYLDTCLDDRREHLTGRDMKISMALYAIRIIPLTTDLIRFERLFFEPCIAPSQHHNPLFWSKIAGA